jgi:GNAT superfamily N-acetyltransferase
MPRRTLSRTGWPRELQRIREELPDHLHHSPPSGAANNGSWVVVAQIQGVAVGIAWAVHAAGNANGAYIEEVAVRRSHQRRGIGRELLWQMASWMAELQREELSILPISGSRWVSQTGFQPLGGGRYEGVATVIASRAPRSPVLSDDNNRWRS